MFQRSAGVFLAAAVAFSAAALADDRDKTYHVAQKVTIEKYTGRPLFDSGFGHFIVGMRARAENGELYDFVITYFGEGQFFPKTGTVCDIKFRYDDIYRNLKNARYALRYGDYIIDPDSRKALGARPPCGCTEVPDEAAGAQRKDSGCTGEQLKEQSASDWTKDSAGQVHMK